MALKYRCGGFRRKHEDGVPYCSYEAERPWTGPCKGCGRYYNCEKIGNEPKNFDKFTFETLATAKPPERMTTGSKEFDFVIGGGLVAGQSIILTGDPGLGKTTLLLQTSRAIAESGKKVLYTSGEQNSDDLSIFVSRLGLGGDSAKNIICLGNIGDVYDITAKSEQIKPALLIVDSIQTAFVPDAGGDVGSNEQLKGVINWITSYGKVEKVTNVIVAHLNKEKKVAGTLALQYLTDTILYLKKYEIFEEDLENEDEDEEEYENRLLGLDQKYLDSLRELVIDKNRYGEPGLRAVIEMTKKGMQTPSKPVSRNILLPA